MISGNPLVLQDLVREGGNELSKQNLDVIFARFLIACFFLQLPNPSFYQNLRSADFAPPPHLLDTPLPTPCEALSMFFSLDNPWTPPMNTWKRELFIWIWNITTVSCIKTIHFVFFFVVLYHTEQENKWFSLFSRDNCTRLGKYSISISNYSYIWHSSIFIRSLVDYTAQPDGVVKRKIGKCIFNHRNNWGRWNWTTVHYILSVRSRFRNRREFDQSGDFQNNSSLRSIPELL